MDDEFLTVKEIADKLKVKTFTVLEWIRKGELSAYKVGKEYRIKTSDFEQFLKDRRTTGQQN
jgi:putative molybdopterin biosynthesis protein